MRERKREGEKEGWRERGKERKREGEKEGMRERGREGERVRKREGEKESEKEGESERDVEYGCFIFIFKRNDGCLGNFWLSS